MMERPHRTHLCMSHVSLLRTLEHEHLDDFDCHVSIPLPLARKLVRAADEIERTRLAMLWVVLAMLVMGVLAVYVGTTHAPRDATHERAHPGEQP